MQTFPFRRTILFIPTTTKILALDVWISRSKVGIKIGKKRKYAFGEVDALKDVTWLHFLFVDLTVRSYFSLLPTAH